MLCSLLVGNVLLFIMRMLSYVMIVTESSIFLMASKMLGCTLDTYMVEYWFSGLISKVHFVVNLFLSTVQ